LKDHHEGYTTWEEFERNQRLLADNANRRSNMGRRSVRRGEALLAGLFLCARCGKKLQVSYSGDPPKQRYVCAGPNNDTFGNKCISFGGLRSDRAVAQEILDRLQPLGIEAALAAIDNYGKEQSAKRRQLENALEQARFEATRAHRQYDQVDPDNRLAAGELERRWNEKLVAVRSLEEQLAQQDGEPTTTLSAEDRQRLLELGTDLPRAWDSVGTAVETRKRIIRLLIDEIIVDAVDDKLELIVHWHGGDHSRMRARKTNPCANFAGVIHREVRDGTGPTRVSHSAHWRQDNQNPALAGFLKLLRERYPSPSTWFLRRAFANARSIAMNRASIGATNFKGSAIGCPVSRASALA
jgi:hypothetical protein